MTPVAAHRIHARYRPTAIAFMFFAELAWALVVATPVHAWARRVWGAHPDGDAVLWIPGGRDLLVWLGQNDAALGVVTRTTLVLLVVGALLMQVPFGALVASLAFGREDALEPPDAGAQTGAAEPDASPPARLRSLRIVRALKIGVASFLPLSALLALGSAVSILVLAVGALAAAGIESAVTDSLGDARAFTVKLVVLALFGVLAAAFGIVVDLARAAVVREQGFAAIERTSTPAWGTMLRGIRAALVTSRRGFGSALLAWTGRVVVGVALLAIGYVASDTFGGRGGTALTLLFIVHQGVVLGRVALRASWMARALSLVAPVQDALEEARSAQRGADVATSER
ncbi:MAG: hypothetical protein JWP87_4276 [Labilithrix sp.]|nr:hypothetical protein [Labilithrix sp.]